MYLRSLDVNKDWEICWSLKRNMKLVYYYGYICCVTLGKLMNLSVYTYVQKENNRFVNRWEEP